MSTNIDDVSSVNEYDGREPSFEQLFTDSDEEYDVNKDIHIESYLDDEEFDDYTSDEVSDVEVKDNGECFASDSESGKIDNGIGKRFDNEDNGKISLEKFMMFVDIKEFRSALTDYTIQENFDVIKVKNEKTRVTAICASEGCPWRIHASPSPDGVGFMIKSYEPKHNCIRRSEKRNANSTWIANKLKESLSADPNMSYELMSKELRTKFGIEAHPRQLYRARKKGKEEVEGSHALSYKKIVKFANLLLEKNRGSIVRLEFYDQTVLEEETRIFKRIFVCLAPCISGFLNCCRPFFGLDGCHLKGPYGGVLLCAVSLDANKGLFPIAFAIVEVECRDSWSFFLSHLHDALGDDRYTIMSDRQKGLTQSVSDYFPNSWHRHCSKHLLNNFKVKYPLLILEDLFWMAIKAPNEFLFKKAMEKMKACDDDAYQYLMNIPLHTWSTHAFNKNHKSPHITNNVCESFNAWIDNLRSMTVLKLVDGLRVKIMMRFYTQFSCTATWQHSVGPRIATEINKITEDARYCRVKPAGGHQYEVYDGFTRFPVNLLLHTCECNIWEISGLLCKHGAAAIVYIREKVENYCHAYYNKDKYIIAYSGLHSPLPDLDTLDDTDVLPPPLRRLPGRPRKSRKRGKDEDAPSNTRRISTIRCSNCKGLGHNRRGCQRAPIKARKIRQEVSTSESQTSIARQTQEYASAQAKAKSQLQAKQKKRNIREGKLPENHSSNITPL